MMFFLFKIARFRQSRLPGTRFPGGRSARKIAPADKKPAGAAGSYGQRWGHILAGRGATPAEKKAALHRVVAVGGKLPATTTRKVRAGAKSEARKADNMTDRKPLIGG